VESEPAEKILQAFAWRELLLRQRINDAARQTMVAYATGTNLDHLGALFGVTRAVVTPGDPAAVPPAPEVLEDDDRFRARIVLSTEALTAAGTVGRYAWHALDADARVRDVSVSSPYPGKVDVHVLSDAEDGVTPADVVAAVDARLQSEEVRTLTDTVAVFAATPVAYTVEARLVTYPGVAGEAVLAAAAERLAAHTAGLYRIGRDVTRSGLYAALHVEGVQRVILEAPTADLEIGVGEIARPTALSVAPGGTDE